MTKFILHGGFTKVDNEENRAFFEEFLRDVPDGGTVLFVYFAAREEKEVPQKFEFHCGLCSKLLEDRKINFVRATKEHFLDELAAADAVFFNGGSTNKLLEILRTYPDLRKLLLRKTVAGSSAGAYAIAALGPSHDEAVVREGLGLAPLRVVCHFESPDLPPSMDSVANLKEMREDLDLVILKDYEWKVFRF